MPRVWDPRELEPRLDDKAETATVDRYAIRLLTAALSVTTMTTFVGASTSEILAEPVRQAAAEDAADARARPAASDRAPDAGPTEPRPAATGSARPTAPTAQVPPGPQSERAPDVEPGVEAEPGPAAGPAAPGPEEQPPGAPRVAPAAPVPPPAHAPAPAPAPAPPAPPAPPRPAPSPTSTPAPAQVIKVTDDAQGEPMFLDAVLAPGATTERCITVTYRGSRPQARVSLQIEASGPLAALLHLSVAVGKGGARDCTGFTAATVLGSGRLADLAAAARPAHYLADRDEGYTLRFSTSLPADVPASAAGARGSASFVWVVE